MLSLDLHTAPNGEKMCSETKDKNSKKKRKRIHDPVQDVVVAYGTSTSEVCMYSPTEGTVVGLLRNGHERGIRDFRFLPEDNIQAWSLGGDGKLVQWDLTKDQVVRYVNSTFFMFSSSWS